MTAGLCGWAPSGVSGGGGTRDCTPHPPPGAAFPQKECDVFWPGPRYPRLYRTGPHGLNGAVRPLSSVWSLCSGAGCPVRGAGSLPRQKFNIYAPLQNTVFYWDYDDRFKPSTL